MVRAKRSRISLEAVRTVCSRLDRTLRRPLSVAFCPSRSRRHAAPSSRSSPPLLSRVASAGRASAPRPSLGCLCGPGPGCLCCSSSAPGPGLRGGRSPPLRCAAVLLAAVCPIRPLAAWQPEATTRAAAMAAAAFVAARNWVMSRAAAATFVAAAAATRAAAAASAAAAVPLPVSTASAARQTDPSSLRLLAWAGLRTPPAAR